MASGPCSVGISAGWSLTSLSEPSLSLSLAISASVQEVVGAVRE